VHEHVEAVVGPPELAGKRPDRILVLHVRELVADRAAPASGADLAQCPRGTAAIPGQEMYRPAAPGQLAGGRKAEAGRGPGDDRHPPRGRRTRAVTELRQQPGADRRPARRRTAPAIAAASPRSGCVPAQPVVRLEHRHLVGAAQQVPGGEAAHPAADDGYPP
jgi:hypothetical protein